MNKKLMMFLKGLLIVSAFSGIVAFILLSFDNMNAGLMFRVSLYSLAVAFIAVLIYTPSWKRKERKLERRKALEFEGMKRKVETLKAELNKLKG